MQQPKPDNYLVLAIISTVCCCLPTGIYAIIKACEVNSSYNMGRYEDAVRSANEAKKWSIIGIIVGAVISILYGTFTAFGILGSANLL